MDLSFTDEQEAIRASLRRYLAVQAPATDLWSDLARDLGIAGIGVSASEGGYGGSIELMIVAQELGRALAVTPLIDTTVMAAPVLIAASPTGDIITSIASGKRTIACAVFEPTMRFAIEGIDAQAQRTDAGGWRISGFKNAVCGIGDPDYLVAARTAGRPGDRNGLSLFLVPSKTHGLERFDYQTIDGGAASDIRLQDVIVGPEALIGMPGTAGDIIEAMLDRGRVMLAAEAVGVMTRALNDTIEYVKMRRQFGNTLSEMQAVQHRIADMYVQLELASGAAVLALLKLESQPNERRKATAAAAATCARAGRFIGQNAVQLHGGMGVTEECLISKAFRRLTVIDGAMGTLDFHMRTYEGVREEELSQSNSTSH